MSQVSRRVLQIALLTKLAVNWAWKVKVSIFFRFAAPTAKNQARGQGVPSKW